jgi:hypothetical protein
MTVKEMQACADETLDYFLEVMPDAPFGVEDIIVEFVPKSKMAERAKALCALYVPDKIINDSQAEQFENSIAGNALIGKEKSAVIMRLNYRTDYQQLRTLLFHEFTHIYCAKTEMDGKHFIDIYGSGTTPENPNMTPEEAAYDGQLVMGHHVWSEFIAQYYALIHTVDGVYSFDNVADFTIHFLSEVTQDARELSMDSFAQVCAHLLSCCDADEILENLNQSDFLYDSREYNGEQTRKAFQNCLCLLYDRIGQEMPWKINKEFIDDLGGCFFWFRSMNTLFFKGADFYE